MKVEILKIGPDEAAALLGVNTQNRHIRETHTARLAADMRNGCWRPGSTILLAGNGEDRRLLDGQHRLLAVIESGVTIEVVAISGLAHEDQLVVDTGMKRNLSDALTLYGEKNTAALASAIGWYWKRSNGHVRDSQRPTVLQGLAILHDHPVLRECLPPVRAACDRLKISRGLAACLFYEQLVLDGDDAADFWNMLASGLVPDQNEQHPIHLLYERLQEDNLLVRKRLDILDVHALIIKAWNAYRAGRDLKLLKWARGGAKPESFPELS